MSNEEKVVDLIINSLRKEPTRWMLGEYTLATKDPDNFISNAVRIWIANGWTSCNLYQHPYNLSLRDRYKLWKEVRRYMEDDLKRRLKGEKG